MGKLSPKLCPDCDVRMLEVKDAVLEGEVIHCMYPKPIVGVGYRRMYHEYRLFCSVCKTEWIYNSRPDCRWFEEVPGDSQFFYDEEKGLLVLREIGYL